MVRLLAKVSPLDLGVADHLGRRAVRDLLAGDQHDQALRELHHGAHDVLDEDDGDAALVEPDEQVDDVVDFRLREPGHGLVGDQELRVRRHSARELELAHLHLREVARKLRRLVGERDQLQQLGAALIERGRRQRGTGPRIDGVEQRYPQVVGDREGRERPRQLEAARHAAAGALVGEQAVDDLAVKTHRAGLVGERAADAVDECRLAGAVRTDQADALALGDGKIDAVERDEAAEAFAQTRDFEQCAGHYFSLLRIQPCTSPTMPFGAMMTKATSSSPTMSRLTAEEMVTVAICCKDPSRIAPIRGPTQLVVPPIIGIAMELTAYSSPNADDGCR